MSYPAPPGLSQASHPSLPARPPQSAGASSSARPSGFAPAFTAFKPRSLASQHEWRGASPSVAAAPVTAARYDAAAQPAYPQDSGVYQATPQIQNPFPLPGQGVIAERKYDPETEAQIAQWQSTYAAKDGAVQQPTNTPALEAVPQKSRPIYSSTAKETVIRTGGGKTWHDSSLLDWDPAHYRLFVGNLAGEVTDDSLFKAFNKWKSLQKARVIREHRTSKSRGYGFVSFSNGDHYFQAFKEMQGKYIGSHPVLLKRATADINPVIPEDRNKGKGKHKKGANTGAGVKKAAKTKNGLKILG